MPGTQAEKAQTFRALHSGPAPLIMPNAWDAASAQRVEAAGFPAIATTSGGVAVSIGYEDHEGAPVDEMLAAAERMVRAVSLPVTVDFETGYGLEPAEIVRRLAEIGAVGMNLEDSDLKGDGLVPAELQAERLAAVKAAAQSAGVDLVLNARLDVFIRGEGNLDAKLAEGIRRGRLYREAGADCIYPIFLRDVDAIREMVAACDVVNLVVTRSGPLSLADAIGAGARRITYATSIFRETMAALDSILAEVNDAIPAANSQ